MGRFPSLDARSRIASFKIRAIAEPGVIPTSIPEPGSVVGILTIGLLGIGAGLSKSTQKIFKCAQILSNNSVKLLIDKFNYI